MIKFFDLHRQDKLLIKPFIKDLQLVLRRNDFILGKKVSEFERKFSKFCKAKYAIGVANGTDALTLALKALNLKKNSEVIIPAMTYCSTAFAVLNANLKPVLVDIEKNSPLIDIDKIADKINSKTKVIMPVHLYGSVVNISKIRKVIGKKNIIIIDDCSQAHGASHNLFKKKNFVGSMGDISCFSLYPGKNLGAYGDAGIITTNNQKFYKIIKNLRNLGSDKKFEHTRIGYNSRLDTMQSLILLRKLRNLNANNNKRRKIANLYDKKIYNLNIQKISYTKSSVYHQYVIKTSKRKKLIDLFKKNQVQFGFHYPKSINQLKVFKRRFKNKKFFNAEILAQNGLSLPIDPNLKINEINKVIKLVNSI